MAELDVSGPDFGLVVCAALLFALSVVLFYQLGVQWAASTRHQRGQATLFVLLAVLAGFWCLAVVLGRRA